MVLLVAQAGQEQLRELEELLSAASYQTRGTTSGQLVLDWLAQESFDLILLDTALLAPNGIEVCRRLRAAGAAAPVLFISSCNDTSKRVAALDAGADDFLGHPSDPGELLARIRALLRGRGRAAILEVEGLRLDPALRRVTLDGTELQMSATELSLLEYLLHNAGRVLSRSVLLDHVWHGRITSENVVEVYIAYLRKKLGRHAHLIQTVRGAGYRLDSAPSSGGQS